MSLLQIYKQGFQYHTAVHNPESSKLVKEDDVVDGILVQKYSFKTQNVSDDARQNIHYQDLALSNLQRLGVIDQLKPRMLQKDDVDLVTSQIELLYESQNSKVPSQNNQTGQGS